MFLVFLCVSLLAFFKLFIICYIVNYQFSGKKSPWAGETLEASLTFLQSAHCDALITTAPGPSVCVCVCVRRFEREKKRKTTSKKESESLLVLIACNCV